MSITRHIIYRLLPVVIIIGLAVVVMLRSPASSSTDVSSSSITSVSRKLAGLNGQKNSFILKAEPITAPVKSAPSSPATPVNVSELPKTELATSPTETTPATINVKLIIQQPNKKSQWSFQVIANSTVDATMRWASSQYHFSYGTKQYSGLGTFVDELNGVKSDTKSGMYWFYYINGTPAAIGVSNFTLHEGDVITWKYGSG